jgi:CP family cyanate transporter-like MFS transporter
VTGQRIDRLAVLGSTAVLEIALIAATMRGPFTSVGPLLDVIRLDTGLSSSGAGVLSMLPLLAFAAVSPVASGLATRIGLERAIGAALGILVIGLVVRSWPSLTWLFTGTALIGVAIGLVNVLLSALIKRDHPDLASSLTGLYITTMGAFAMIGSGIAVPAAGAMPGGWRAALGLWVIVAAVALIAWFPRLRTNAPPAPSGRPPDRSHWRSRLAWQLTAFMGLQSLGFYVAISWLPTILHSQGLSPAVAGWYVALMQLTGLLASAATPLIVRRLPDQRLFAAGAAVLGVLSYLGFVVAPELSLLWTATVGLSQGAGITLALSFFALRAHDARQAAALSGMGQSLGYLLAALGPLLFGILHDAASSWTPPLLILAGLITAQAVVALPAGRARQVPRGQPDRR